MNDAGVCSERMSIAPVPTISPSVVEEEECRRCRITLGEIEELTISLLRKESCAVYVLPWLLEGASDAFVRVRLVVLRS